MNFPCHLQSVFTSLLHVPVPGPARRAVLTAEVLHRAAPSELPWPADRAQAPPGPACSFLGSPCPPGKQELVPLCSCQGLHQEPALPSQAQVPAWLLTKLLLPSAAPGPEPSEFGLTQEGLLAQPGALQPPRKGRPAVTLWETLNTCPQKNETRHQPVLWDCQSVTGVLRLQLPLRAPPPILLCTGTTLAPQVTGKAPFPQPATSPLKIAQTCEDYCRTVIHLID